jgi:hypothetical protein
MNTRAGTSSRNGDQERQDQDDRYGESGGLDTGDYQGASIRSVGTPARLATGLLVNFGHHRSELRLVANRDIPRVDGRAAPVPGERLVDPPQTLVQPARRPIDARDIRMGGGEWPSVYHMGQLSNRRSCPVV